MRSVSNRINLYNPTSGLNPQLVSAWRHTIAMISVTVAGSAGGVLKFAASANEDAPNFGNAASRSNGYAPVMVKDLNTGTTYAGSAGYPVTATGVYIVEINTNLITWLGLILDSLNGAVFTVDIISGGND